MTEKPRTWTMQRWDDKFEEQADVKVIELEAVLDLLEGLLASKRPSYKPGMPCVSIARLENIEALLREHGRLK